jgi:hypothetical protein
MHKIVTSLSLVIALFFLNSCGIYKKMDARKTATAGPERAKQNIKEGRGISIKNARDSLSRSGTAYEFSTSNAMWRASLEILDFVPLTTVDYSGGIIITDWYSDAARKNESIKITIRFLSNEIKANNLKISIFKKECDRSNNCSTKLSKSKIENELRRTILQQAALLDKNKKK